MNENEDEFLDLLREVRNIFSEDNVNQTPLDIDIIIEQTENSLLNMIKDKHQRRKARKHVEKLLIDKLESNLTDKRIYEEEIQNLKEIYTEQLEIFTDISYEELVEEIHDIKVLEEQLPDDIVDTVELTEDDIHKVLEELDDQYRVDDNVSLIYVAELRAKY